MTDLDLSQAVWRTSSYSGNTGGDCVEVAFIDTAFIDTAFAADLVAVRDSKNRSGPVLAFDARAWAAFLGNVRAGEPA